MKLKLTVNGIVYEVEVEVEEETPQTLGTFASGGATSLPPAPTAPSSGSHGTGDGIRAPLAGTVSQILVEAGQDIETGQTLVVLEAMKMETAITAPSQGKVSAVLVSKGESVQGGQLLIELQ